MSPDWAQLLCDDLTRLTVWSGQESSRRPSYISYIYTHTHTHKYKYIYIYYIVYLIYSIYVCIFIPSSPWCGYNTCTASPQTPPQASPGQDRAPTHIIHQTTLPSQIFSHIIRNCFDYFSSKHPHTSVAVSTTVRASGLKTILSNNSPIIDKWYNFDGMIGKYLWS